MNDTADRLYVVASGHAHPTTALDNAALETSVPDLKSGWLEQRLGITSRRVTAPHEHIGEFAAASVVDALGDAGWSGEQVDMLICATSFVDDVLPATASTISRDICPDAIAFDINAACASFPYALAVAESMVQTRPEIERVVVCAAERPTVWADYQDRDSSIYWGDSAGCVLLTRTRPARPSFRLLGVALVNDNAHPEKVRVRHHGVFHHDGRYSYDQVVELSEQATRNLMYQVGTDLGDVRAFVGHQSNTRLLQALGDRLGIPWDRQWHNVEWAGNQAGAGVLTAFSSGWQEQRATLVPGDLVLLAAVGGGYSAGAVLLEWQD